MIFNSIFKSVISDRIYWGIRRIEEWIYNAFIAIQHWLTDIIILQPIRFITNRHNKSYDKTQTMLNQVSQVWEFLLPMVDLRQAISHNMGLLPQIKQKKNYMLRNKIVNSPITKDSIRRNIKSNITGQVNGEVTHFSPMPSLSQLATLATNAHSTEYVFP